MKTKKAIPTRSWYCMHMYTNQKLPENSTPERRPWHPKINGINDMTNIAYNANECHVRVTPHFFSCDEQLYEQCSDANDQRVSN